VFATMHGKEKVVAPIFFEELSVTVITPNNFNTDQFGTFTREIPRHGNQYEAARAKAQAALTLTGYDLAIASEGSFSAHPSLPFVMSNLEIILLIDAKNQLEIIGNYRSNTVTPQSQTVGSADEAVTIATSWGFPTQGVILRQNATSTTHLYKDISTIEELHTIAHRMLSTWFVSSLFMETDMRAHRCPPRRESIKNAATDLIHNCQSLCPKCATPGFVIREAIAGLPCSQCHRPTTVTKELLLACQKCTYTEIRPATASAVADSGDCEWCNP
jgi:hypothetical protein